MPDHSRDQNAPARLPIDRAELVDAAFNHTEFSPAAKELLLDILRRLEKLERV